MSTFKEANQVRVALKMKLIQYSWYKSSNIAFANNDYAIVINTTRIDNTVKKIIPPVLEGVNIKIEIE